MNALFLLLLLHVSLKKKNCSDAGVAKQTWHCSGLQKRRPRSKSSLTNLTLGQHTKEGRGLPVYRKWKCTLGQFKRQGVFCGVRLRRMRALRMELERRIPR